MRLSIRLVLFAVAASVPLTACGGKGEGEARQEQLALPEGGDRPPLISGREAAAGVEGEVQRPVKQAQEVAPKSAKSLARELAAFYQSWAQSEGAFEEAYLAALGEALEDAGIFKEALKARYEARGNQPFLSVDGQLTEDAEVLIVTLAGDEALVGDGSLAGDGSFAGVESHGLDGAAYELEKLTLLLSDYRALVAEQPAFPDDEDALWAFVQAQRPTGDGELSEEALNEAALAAGWDDGDLGALSDLRREVETRMKAFEGQGAQLATVDAFLMSKLYRWVFDMRFLKVAHPFLAARSEAQAYKAIQKDMEALIDGKKVGGKDEKAEAEGEVVPLESPGRIAKLIQDVVPRHPSYESLRRWLAQYREWAGAYPEHLEIPRNATRLRQGSSGDGVRNLETRLAQEGYYDEEVSGKWGKALTEAVKAYQETHQMAVTGKIDAAMIASMNVSFARRADWIALSLQRYRESELHQGPNFFGETAVQAQINVPAMEARFYKNGELARVHKVVVGNNATEKNHRVGKSGKLNQTKLFTAEMSTIVLNPVWNVPRRIKEQELDILLMDEPDYYEKHNYKVEIGADGYERVIQQPGPNNALGLVKFLFPNEYAIYMHDTPSKRLFDRPVRAFSHGCIRTQDPLDLARWILVELTERMSDEEFDAILAAREERHFAVRPRIPITTDYATAHIDEEGRVVFTADIYQFDKSYFEGKVPFKSDRDLPNTVVF